MPRDLPGDEDLGAEPARLLQRAARQLVARDARREAEVVLDPRRGAGLAARRLALDHDRAQPLRSAVHRGRQPGRARRRRSPCRTRRPPARCASPSSSATRRSCGRTTVLPPTTRIAGQSPSAGSGPPHCSASRPARRAGATERDLVAVEEAPQLRAGGIPALPDDDRPGRRRLGRDALQAARLRPSGRLASLPTSRPDLRRDGGERVVVVRLDPQHARRLSRPEPDRERRVPSVIGTSPKMSPGCARRRRAPRRRRA